MINSIKFWPLPLSLICLIFRRLINNGAGTGWTFWINCSSLSSNLSHTERSVDLIIFSLHLSDISLRFLYYFFKFHFVLFLSFIIIFTFFQIYLLYKNKIICFYMVNMYICIILQRTFCMKMNLKHKIKHNF